MKACLRNLHRLPCIPVVLLPFAGSARTAVITGWKLKRLRNIASEACDARWAGDIPWCTDQVKGEALGKKVADHALATMLRPAN